MGVDNSGVLYALWSYPAQNPDELSFREGDMVTILQKPEQGDWWWASLCGREGFVPNNYFGVSGVAIVKMSTPCEEKQVGNISTSVLQAAVLVLPLSTHWTT